MKVMHLSDLHLGKRVNEFSMIDDQRYILKQVMDIVINDKADAVMTDRCRLCRLLNCLMHS